MSGLFHGGDVSQQTCQTSFPVSRNIRVYWWGEASECTKRVSEAWTRAQLLMCDPKRRAEPWHSDRPRLRAFYGLTTWFAPVHIEDFAITTGFSGASPRHRWHYNLMP